MMQGPPFHRHVVDKGAVETLEIEDDKLIVFSFNLGMTPRHGSVGDAERGGGFAADDDRQIFNGEDAAFESSGNGCESRVHPSRCELEILRAQVYASSELGAIAFQVVEAAKQSARVLAPREALRAWGWHWQIFSKPGWHRFSPCSASLRMGLVLWPTASQPR